MGKYLMKGVGDHFAGSLQRKRILVLLLMNTVMDARQKHSGMTRTAALNVKAAALPSRSFTYVQDDILLTLVIRKPTVCHSENTECLKNLLKLAGE